MSDTIYSSADVAQLLRVGRAAVSNWKMRHSDTPEPQYVTLDGREFWTREGMRAWLQWHEKRNAPPVEQPSEAIEQLRHELTREV